MIAGIVRFLVIVFREKPLPHLRQLAGQKHLQRGVQCGQERSDVVEIVA